MSNAVRLVVCDHHCRPDVSVDYEKLRTDLCAADSIEDLVVAPTACRGGLPKLKIADKMNLVIAGCPAVSQAENYAEFAEATPAERRHFIVADTRTEVFDQYRSREDDQDNLRRKLLSLSLVMSAVGGEEAAHTEIGGPVLVVGDGFAGVLTALHLQSLGVTVELARSHGDFYSPGSYHLSLLSPALEEQLKLRLDECQTWLIPENPRAVISGDSILVASGPDGPRRYASFVLVPEQIEVASRESGALSLADCYNRITHGEDFRGSTCFLLDQHNATDSGTFSDVLRAALYIVTRYRGEVTILMQDARVSGTAGQRLYDTCREAGVVFVKYGDDLTVEGEFGDFVLAGTDVQSATQFTLFEPQTMVIPGTPDLPLWAHRLLASLAMRDGGGSTQDESLWLMPNATNRAAVFTAGAGRRRMDADEIVRDSVSAALLAAHMLTSGDAEAHTAVVREGSCVRCLTCVRTCPFGAIRKEPGHRAVMANPAECRGCGICAAVCPAHAIELQDRSSDALVDSIAVFQGLLVLHCAEGGRKAIRRMIETGHSLPSDVSLYEVPCSGRVEESLLLDVLGRDIRGVLVIGCRKDNCKFLDGNIRGENRIRRLQRILNDAGIERSHVEMMFAAPDEGSRVHDAIVNAYERMSSKPYSTATTRPPRKKRVKKG